MTTPSTATAQSFPALKFAQCNSNTPMDNPPNLQIQEGAPVTTVNWGGARGRQPDGGDACYKVRLASPPSRPHTFYATVKQYRDDKPPLGISGKDVYRYVRGGPTGSRLERRTHYHWDWIDKTVDDFASPKRGGAGDKVKVQYFANNYSQTHQFTADNWNQWVTISVRCCRLRTGVDGVPVTGVIGAFGVANNERNATIYHYIYDNHDQEGRTGPNTNVYINPPARQNSPAQESSPSQPTDPVTNVQATAADDSSATVTWDAVAHATSYLIDYEGTASDPYNTVAGTISGHTGTSWTLQHNAAESMTITVTITPEYLDSDGFLQQADSLAGTATLDVVVAQQASPEQAEHSCVPDAVLADAQGYAGETWRESPDHVERWNRVLAAFGENNSYSNNPMTATEAQPYADRGLPRWVPVVTALQCLETAPEQQPEEQPAQAEAEAPTPAPPPATSCVSGTMLDTVRGYYDANKDRAPGYGLNWKRVLIAFGDMTDADQTAFTAAEAKERETRWFGWKPVRQTLECVEAAN